MEVFLMYFLFAVGLVLIIKGGDFFVDAAVWFAEVSGIPHFIVGATVVGFATSLPEILVSVIAASQGDVQMATGNAIGSVTAYTRREPAVYADGYTNPRVLSENYAPDSLYSCSLDIRDFGLYLGNRVNCTGYNLRRVCLRKYPRR